MKTHPSTATFPGTTFFFFFVVLLTGFFAFLLVFVGVLATGFRFVVVFTGFFVAVALAVVFLVDFFITFFVVVELEAAGFFAAAAAEPARVRFFFGRAVGLAVFDAVFFTVFVLVFFATLFWKNQKCADENVNFKNKEQKEHAALCRRAFVHENWYHVSISYFLTPISNL